MSVTPIPQVMASLGNLERIAYEVQTQPETQAAAAQANVTHTLKQESGPIKKTEAGQEGQKIRPDDEKERSRRQPQQRARGKNENKPAPQPDNPWSGNLLNVQI